MQPLMSYPRINGFVPDFATISLNVTIFGLAQAGLDLGQQTAQPSPGIIDIRAIDYSSKNNAKYKWLTGPYPVARPRGQVSAAASIEWGFLAWRQFLQYLRNSGVGGMSDAILSIGVVYSLNPGDTPITDTLPDARVIDSHVAHAVGGKELVQKVTLSIPDVLWGLPDGTQVPTAANTGNVQGFQ